MEKNLKPAKKRSIKVKFIVMAMLAGLAVGLACNFMMDIVFVEQFVVGFVFKLISGIFLNLIQLVVVPLVLFSLISGTAEMGDITKLGRVGSKTVGIYLITTAVALIIAITVGLIANPGIGFDISAYSDVIANYKPKESVPLLTTLLNIFPKNPFKALSDGNMLQVIVFAIFTGTAITVLGDKAGKAREVISELNAVTMQIITFVMSMAPIGVFFLTASTFSTLGLNAFVPLMKYILASVLALFLHCFICYGALLKGVLHLSASRFLKNFAPAISLAFSSASSNATLPVALDSVTNKCGVDQKISSFTMPLGCTINMDGSAITQAMATVFIAQAFGANITITFILSVVLIATLSSIGNVGVPSASMVTLAMVFTQVGLPAEAIGIIVGVDYIISMTRTMLNVSGDAICTMVVAKSEGMFNKDIFNADVKPSANGLAE